MHVRFGEERQRNSSTTLCLLLYINAHGINVYYPEADELRAIVHDLALGSLSYLDRDSTDEISIDNFLVHEDYLGGGYGLPTEAAKEAIQLTATHEALMLDPVYTGKAMSGLIDLIAQGVFRKDESILFIHTGGTPALFAYEDSLL